MKRRFKIDHYGGSTIPIGLFIEHTHHGWFRTTKCWALIDNFRTREEALTLHAQIKDMPEYLD